MNKQKKTPRSVFNLSKIKRKLDLSTLILVNKPKEEKK